MQGVQVSESGIDRHNNNVCETSVMTSLCELFTGCERSDKK